MAKNTSPCTHPPLITGCSHLSVLLPACFPLGPLPRARVGEGKGKGRGSRVCRSAVLQSNSGRLARRSHDALGRRSNAIRPALYDETRSAWRARTAALRPFPAKMDARHAAALVWRQKSWKNVRRPMMADGWGGRHCGVDL